MNKFIPSKGQCWKTFQRCPVGHPFGPLFRNSGTKTAGGEEEPLSSFGSGPIKVRLYTDYFCPPCRDMEPDLEPLILDLVKDGTIQLTFIDVPTSRNTPPLCQVFPLCLGGEKGY